jgi:hypothetical protein
MASAGQARGGHESTAAGGGGWLQDVVVGALGSGVNLPTLVLLNVITGGAVLTIALLLALSIYTNPPLVPHVCVLLVLSIGLWVAINWFISNVGLVEVAQQEKELFDSGDPAADAPDEQQPEAKKDQ